MQQTVTRQKERPYPIQAVHDRIPIGSIPDAVENAHGYKPGLYVEITMLSGQKRGANV
jgi:hypothetical protein